MKNRGVVLTCKVGARMPMRKHKPKIIRKQKLGNYQCVGGPYEGRVISLDVCSDLKTLTFKCRGMVGQYYGANWLPAS